MSKDKNINFLEDKHINLFKVMIDPRGSMRSIAKLPLVFSLLLAFFYGFDYIVTSLIQHGAVGSTFSMPLFLLFTIIFSIPLGYVSIVVSAAIILWVGKILSGKASYSELVKALFLPKIVRFFQSILLFFILGIYGRTLFVGPVMHMFGYTFFSVIFVAQLVLGFWEFILTLHTIGEAQQFSAWMSLWNLILGSLLFIIICMMLFFFATFFVNGSVVSFIGTKINLIHYLGASYVN